MNAAVTVAAVAGESEWNADEPARLVLQTLQTWELDCDVHFVPRTRDLNTGNTSQSIRLWVPTQYPGDFCVIGDVDMLPLRRNFFQVPRHSDDAVYFWNGDAYAPAIRFPMCYVGADGAVWQQIFPYHDVNDATSFLTDEYHRLIPQYNALELASATTPGWFSDETILSDLLQRWEGYPHKTLVLRSYHFCRRRRLNRSDQCYVQFDVSQSERYLDAHLPRRVYAKWRLFEPFFRSYAPQDFDKIRAYFNSWNTITKDLSNTPAQPSNVR